MIDNDPDTLAGLNLIEKRLLTLLDDTLQSDTERRHGLTDTLERVRREKVRVLKLNPNVPGVEVQSLETETESSAIHKTTTTA